MLAARDGHVAVVNTLIAHGADVHARDFVRTILTDKVILSFHYSSLFLIPFAAPSARPHSNCLSSDVLCRFMPFQLKDTPLMKASVRGHCAVVEALLANGADSNARNRVGALTCLC